MDKSIILLLVVYCALFALILFISTKSKVNGGEFDERQTISRYKAFKYAFIILLTYFTFSEIASVLLKHNWCTHETNVGFGMLFSISAFGCVCIMKDAYVAPNGRSSYTWIMMIIIALLNISIGIEKMLEDDTQFIKDNEVNISLNLLIGAVFLILIICRLIKIAIDKRERD